MNRKIGDRYEIKAKLDEGGMGVVFRAYDRLIERDVALKTLPALADQGAIDLFYKESQILKSIVHPNIIEIFDIGEIDEGGQTKPCFVMPLLPGQTLAEVIRGASYRLSVERVIDIISQTCRGLQAAHDKGLIHRDLKPSNIFVMSDDSVKIIDFGVACIIDARTRSEGFHRGTLMYMAPEAVQSLGVSPQSDIYSLGVVAYEALTRRQPFRAPSTEAIVHAIRTNMPPPASDINPAVSPLVSQVVHKAMAKHPGNRYDSARLFAETLQKTLRKEKIDVFDPARIQPRVDRAATALKQGDHQLAGEIVSELEAAGYVDPQIPLLRTQIDWSARQQTVAQLFDSAQMRYEEGEDALALKKLQEILQLDASHSAALSLKSRIEDRRNERQIEECEQRARQHVENHSYAQARHALRNALEGRPHEVRLLRLLEEVKAAEQEHLRLRREKTEMYQSAFNAWTKGDISRALSEMKLVLELDDRAPDTSPHEGSTTYRSFYDKIRSEHDAIDKAHGEARGWLAENDFAKALQLCDEFLAKYPGQALFLALKHDIDARRRQQPAAAATADAGRPADADPDLEAVEGLQRVTTADHLLAEGKTYCEQGDFGRGIEVLRQALALDDRRTIRMTLCEAFVAGAEELFDSDPAAAMRYAQQALDIDSAHVPAKSLLARVALAGGGGDSRLGAMSDAVGSELEPLQAIATPVDDGQSASTIWPTPAAGAYEATTPGPDTNDKDPPSAPPVASILGRAHKYLTKAREYVRVTSHRRVATAAGAGLALGALLLVTLPPLLSGPSLVTVQVRTFPPGATIRIDDRIRGTSELTLDLAEGTHRLEASLAGFATVTRQVRIDSNARELSFDLVPLPRAAALMVRGMLPGVQVFVDEKPVGTVRSDGTFSLTGIMPGRYTLRFSLPGYQPASLVKDFVASRSVEISDTEVKLTPAPATLQFVADATTTVVVSRGNQTIHQFTGPTRLSVAAGTYNVVARGPANVPTSQTVVATAGQSRTVNVQNVVTGIERFQNAGAWRQENTWFARRGGGFVLYERSQQPGRITFSVNPDRSRNPFSNGARLKWVIGFIDARNYVLLQLDGRYLSRDEIVDGASLGATRVAHTIPGSNGFIHFSIEVQPSRLIHQYSLDGSRWDVFDVWNRPSRVTGSRSLLDGRFGFYLPDNEEIKVANFLFYPSS